MARARDRAIEALLVETSYTVSSLWVVKQLTRVNPHEGLERVVERWAPRFSADPNVGIIDPEAPRVRLPADPGTGVVRFYQYIRAPWGRPESRALEFIRDFVASEEAGYVLTHQVLVLEWARQAGLELPAPLTALRPELLARMAAEQAADGRFSDLYAERTGLLLWLADPVPAEAPAWIDRLLAAQLPDGGWTDSSGSVIDFYGQPARVAHPRSHTSAWATLALASFLARD